MRQVKSPGFRELRSGGGSVLHVGSCLRVLETALLGVKGNVRV
jgi:hypothetical protein